MEATGSIIYFLNLLLFIHCIPMFDYYDQLYDQIDYDDQNNVDSNSTNRLDSNETENAPSNPQEIEKYSVEYSNGTAKDLYLIRTIIYEIGILANPDDTKNSSVTSETQDQIDISIFKPTKEELIDDTKIPAPIKGQVERLTNSALRSLDVIPLIELSTKNKSSTEIRQLSFFPNSFVRLTANISTVRGDDTFKTDFRFNQEEPSSTLIRKHLNDTRVSDYSN